MKSDRWKPNPTPVEKMCSLKRRFSDEYGARAFASITAKSNPHGRMSVYSCRHCRGWHISNSAGKRANRVTPETLYETPAHDDAHALTPQFGGFWGGE